MHVFLALAVCTVISALAVDISSTASMAAFFNVPSPRLNVNTFPFAVTSAKNRLAVSVT